MSDKFDNFSKQLQELITSKIIFFLINLKLLVISIRVRSEISEFIRDLSSLTKHDINELIWGANEGVSDHVDRPELAEHMFEIG
jgi:hypothetical protein